VPTTSVSYVAANRVLLIMDEQSGLQVERQLGDGFLCFMVVRGEGSKLSSPGNIWQIDDLELSGYLGRYSARLPQADEGEDSSRDLGEMMGIANGLFDQVIDTSSPPLISAAIKPPGYHHADNDPAILSAAVESVLQLVGEFEKPRYFSYNPDICAHGRSGITGCTRCIEACPTDAIISIGEQIEVNPHLCQGGGTCAASCPSGAITYQYPQVGEQIEFIRRALRDWRKQDDCGSTGLLVYDNEHGAEMVQANDRRLPEHVFPLLLEEIGSLAPELLASAVAYGVDEIYILVPDDIPPVVRSSIESSVRMLEAVLARSSGVSSKIILSATLESVLEASPSASTRDNVATFAGVGGKRSALRNALRSLLEHSGIDEPVAMPAGSPLGQVILEQEACTLCMGCVSVCPGNALEAGGEVPALRFIESNCVQCGICTKACPESAITLEPRFNPQDAATRSRILKEEEPFRCIQCGKPFATQSMIGRMEQKLAGHWMFQKPEQRNRLRMCEDCRVADMFDREDVIS
jgi:ferredoxin